MQRQKHPKAAPATRNAAGAPLYKGKAPSTEGRGNGKARFFAYRDRIEAYAKQGYTAKSIFQSFSVEMAMSYQQFARLFAKYVKGKEASVAPVRPAVPAPPPVRRALASSPSVLNAGLLDPAPPFDPYAPTGRITGSYGKNPKDYI